MTEPEQDVKEKQTMSIGAQMVAKRYEKMTAAERSAAARNAAIKRREGVKKAAGKKKAK